MDEIITATSILGYNIFIRLIIKGLLRTDSNHEIFSKIRRSFT